MLGHCRGWKEASLTELLCVVPGLLGSILETCELWATGVGKVEFGTLGQWLQVLAKPLASFMCSPRLLAGMRLRRECSARLEYGSSLLGYLQDSGRWDILKPTHGRS